MNCNNKTKEQHIRDIATLQHRITELENKLKKHSSHLRKAVKDQKNKLTSTDKQLTKVEESLEETEIKYSNLVEYAKDGVSIVQDGIYKFANQAMEKITGYSVNELMGKPLLDIIAPESKSFVAKRHKLCIAGEKVPSFYQAKIQCKDGMIKDVEVSTSIIKHNKKLATMRIIRDITEYKRMREELQKTERYESLAVLAGGIAHDFNNILVSIIGSLALLRLHAKTDSKFSKILTRAEKASTQAVDLTRQLLSFSKGGAPTKENASISELIKDTATFSLKGSNVKYEFSIPDDLWSVKIDKNQISRVINNLIINADHSMPKGGIIKLWAENVTVGSNDNLSLKKGRYVKISVQDQGNGVPEKYLDKIFDPYFTTKKKGSGLGLANCYSIIKKHSGYITVKSELGVGTTFDIYLPNSLKKVVTDAGKETRLRASEGKILFMDDKQSVRDVIGDMLIDLGYEVEFAVDGAEAIKLYKKKKETGRSFDAVILDLTITNGMGGEKAIQKLLKIDPDVKSIASSGYTNDPVISDYKIYGFSEVIVKPYDIDKLSQVLHNVIRRKEEPYLEI